MSQDANEPMDEMMQGLLGDFLDESAGLLAQLNEHLVVLDKIARNDAGDPVATPSPELLNQMFRAAHSLKGLSGMLRLDDINGLTHRVENILDAARNGGLIVTCEVVEVISRALDRLELMISLLGACDRTTVDCGPVLQAIDEILTQTGNVRAIRSQAEVEQAMDSLQHALEEAAAPTPPGDAPATDWSDPLADIVDDKDAPAKYLAIFIDEGQMTFDNIIETLLSADGPKRVESLLVCFHRIKGSAASIGLQRIARVAHLVEDFLQCLRRDDQDLAVDAADSLLQCVDCLRSYVSGIASAQPNDQALSDACRQISGLANLPRAVPSPASREPVVAPAGEQAAASVTALGPSIQTSMPQPATDGSSEPRSAGAAPSKAATEVKTKPTETLRVDIERLDKLMSLAGQLVINKARFTQIGDSLKRMATFKAVAQSIGGAQHAASRLTAGIDELAALAPSPAHDALCDVARNMVEELGTVQHELIQLGKVRTLINDLSEAVHQLDRVSEGIQKTVMETRMVPIGPLFTRFNRVVRDLVRDNKKEIVLEILGEGTELDKRMIDELGDPLIHLIRNSTDHGVEKPDDRLAAGKPRQGTIRLNAFHRGNRIVIEITDDGRGLDAERILAKAISKGLVNEAEAEKLSRQQIYQFIWQPGFSTAERVTEVSGRGMGMDIVWSKIEQLNGTIELTSEPGQGTTFAIKLPLTMAIQPSLLWVIDNDVFAVPVESVMEIVRLSPADLATVHGRRTAHVRGRVVSLTELAELFAWAEPPIRNASADSAEGATIVIVGAEGREIGLLVDSLLGEQDIVIKSIAENFENLEGVAGASILGDGRVSLILDVGVLIEMACRPPQAEPLDHATRQVELVSGYEVQGNVESIPVLAY